MRRIFLLGFFILALVCAFWVLSDHADAADCTWKQSSGALASLNGNWENGTAPTTGDNVYFTSLSTAACTWDVSASLNYFSIGSGYSGTITQGNNDINIGTRGYYQAGGTLSGSASYWIVINGNLVYASGTIGTSCCFKLIGSGTTWNYASNVILKFWVTGTVTLTNTLLMQSTNNRVFQIDAGATLTISSTKTIDLPQYGTSQYINNGIIYGPGSLVYRMYDADRTTALGDVRCDLTITIHSGSAAGHILTLSGNSNNIGIVSLNSLSATYSCTLNLAGYSFGCSSLTVGTRGVLLGSGLVSCTGNFNSYNGTTSGSWSLTMTGTSPYIKTTAGNTVNGLTWTATNLRLASSLNITKTFYVGGTSTVGSYYVAVKNGCNVTVTNGNTWTLMGQTRYWNRVIVAGTLTCATPVSIWCNGTVYFNGTVNNNIVLHCNGWVNSMGGFVGNIWIETAYRNHIYYNGTFVRLNWNLTIPWTLVEGFTPNPGDAYSKAGTMTIITSIGHWMNISSLAGVPFIIDLVTWSILEGTYDWHIQNLGAVPTVFTFSLYLAVDESEMSVYRNNVFMQVLHVEEGGYLSFYDTLPMNDEVSYLLVPGSATASNIDWYVVGFCIAILALLTFMALRNEMFFIIAGLAWISISVLEFQPIQNTVALITLGVGIIFAVWGAYKYAYE